MAATKGRDFLLKVGDGGSPGIYTTLGGFTSRDFGLENSVGDVTNQDSGGYRELLAGAGITSHSFSGSGTFVDDAAFATAQTNARAQTLDDYQVVVPGLGTFEGQAIITSLRETGEHEGGVQFSISLEFSGLPEFTTA